MMVEQWQNRKHFHFFIENIDFWDKCDSKLSSSVSEQLVYYFIKDSLLNQQLPFTITSKYVKFSDISVFIVKVKKLNHIDYYVVRRNNKYQIVVDKLVPSYRKRFQLFVNEINEIYEKPKTTFVNFLQKYNVIRIFKE